MEEEAIAVDAVVKEFDEFVYVALQAYIFTCGDKVLPAHGAEFRVVPQEIGELSALLHEVRLGETTDSVLKPGDAQHFAQDDTRVVVAESLVEVTRH
jgi:hypothetical protein